MKPTEHYEGIGKPSDRKREVLTPKDLGNKSIQQFC